MDRERLASVSMTDPDNLCKEGSLCFSHGAGCSEVGQSRITIVQSYILFFPLNHWSRVLPALAAAKISKESSTHLWTGVTLLRWCSADCGFVAKTFGSFQVRDGSGRGWWWPHWWVPSLRNYNKVFSPQSTEGTLDFWSVHCTKWNQNWYNFHFTKFLFSSSWHRLSKSSWSA